MTLETRLIALAQAMGTDVKTLTTKQGDLSALTTTAKTSLVAALNEIQAALAGAGVTINDAAGNGATTVTWSADKIFDTIEAAKTAVKSDLTAGASTALDTLNELATALGNDPSFATTIATGLANRVRYDAAQTLNLGQQQQACANLGVGDPDHSFAADYAAAKA